MSRHGKILRAPTRSRGFTLIEMLIVIAIIMVLAVIALTSQSSFNRSFLLANTAYDVALTIRGAQNYGVGGQTIGASSVGYGVDFQLASPRAFILFADSFPDVNGTPLCHPVKSGEPPPPNPAPGDCRYEAGSDVQAASYKIGNGISIQDFCVDVPSGATDNWECASGGSFAQLDIVFARPNATTYMAAGTSGGSWLYSENNPFRVVGQTITKACIKLTSSSGGLAVVEVNAAGEITATGNACI